jgi:hypothetical protein
MERAEFLTTLVAAALAPAAGAPAAGASPLAPLFPSMPSAPFPHASRSTGHVYQKVLYSAAAHYSDSTVGIFKPPGYVDRDTVDYIVHFHGWNNNVRHVFERYNLAAQVTGSNVNAILVVPQGPLDAPDSGDGKLELDPGGFARLIGDVTQYLNAQGLIQTRTLGNIVLSAHSGGYGGLGGVLTRGGLNDHISDVLLFDAAYGYFDSIAGWAKSSAQNHLLSIFTGDTSTGNAALMGMVQAPLPNLYVRLAASMTLAQLQMRAPTFVLTDVAHDELLQKQNWYQLFLQTTALKAR